MLSKQILLKMRIHLAIAARKESSLVRIWTDRSRPVTLMKLELTKLGLPKRSKVRNPLGTPNVWMGLNMWVYSATSFQMMELESTTVKRIEMNLLLPTMNETNLFGFVIPNEDKATFQPTWTMISQSSQSCLVVSEVAFEMDQAFWNSSSPHFKHVQP